MLNMSWRKGKTPGWASFDRKHRNKHRNKHSLDAGIDDEPFPPMPTPLRPCKSLTQGNGLKFPEKSFSSVVVPLATGIHHRKEPLGFAASGSEHKNRVYRKLKDLHCWADESLIKDVMEAVDDDVVKASALLEEMVSTGVGNNEEDKHGLLREDACFSNLGNALEGTFNDTVSTDKYFSCDDRILSEDNEHLQYKLGQMSCVPFEPEWEEDDIYLRHRRDALRIARAASQHSKAASNAFARGDHFSAQELSLKAQEEWMDVEKLNAAAAKKILSIRNDKNELWKLDLHGLHAAEAVHAVQEHLQKIEFASMSNHSVSPGRPKMGMVHSSSFESFESLSSLDKVKLDKPRAFAREKQYSLQIITGIGNHSSRGQPALPVAVRSFLAANGYIFHEPRPGVVSVRPKFRR